MTEKLFTGTLNKNKKKQQQKTEHLHVCVLEQDDMQKVVSKGWCKESTIFNGRKMVIFR